MSEQDRDNGQEVRNAEISGLSDEEWQTIWSGVSSADLLKTYGAVVETEGRRDEYAQRIATEILRRMSTGNPQDEGSGRYAPCGCPSCPPNRYDYGQQAAAKAEQRDGRIADYAGMVIRTPEQQNAAAEAERSEHPLQTYRDHVARITKDYAKPERSDGRVSDQRGDNGRKGDNAERVYGTGTTDFHRECQDSRNGGVAQDEGKDKS